MRKGIDVSHWQGIIDWTSVKKDGVDFASIKAGGSDIGVYKDSKFEQNYNNAKNAGIKVGADYFVGKRCKSYEDGVADAKRFIDIIAGKQFEYPVYIDFEAPDTNNKKGNTDACIGFCEVMENADYFCGIYASESFGSEGRVENAHLQS